MLTSKVFLRKTKRGKIGSLLFLLKKKKSLAFDIWISSFTAHLMYLYHSHSLKFILQCIFLGKVLKVVREHYLRDDIWCGSAMCRDCGKDNTALLENTPVSDSDLCDFPHYIVLDTNVVLHQVWFNLFFAFIILLKTLYLLIFFFRLTY